MLLNSKIKIKTTYPLKDLLSWLILIGVVSERWYELAILVFVNIIIATTSKRLLYSKGLFFAFTIIAVLSVANIKFAGYSYYKFIQQFVLLATYTLCYYNFFKYIKRDIDTLFSKYLKMAYYMCLLGFLQFFVYMAIRKDIFLFMYNYDFEASIAPGILRISSIFAEPSQLSVMLTPALVVILLGENKFSDSLKSRHKWIILITVLLTFSTITYLITILVLGYKYLFYKKNQLIRISAISLSVFLLIYFAAFGLISGSSSSNNKEEGVFTDMVMKVSDTFSAFKNVDPKAFELLNLSTYATMTNVWVAINAPQRIAGTGLGTHSQNYYSTYKSSYYYYGQNAEEGYSLFNRIFSEFGVMGALLLFFLLSRNINKSNVINIAVFFFILSQTIRGGHYIRYGVIMYVFLFYYSGWFYVKLQEKQNRILAKSLSADENIEL